jgi:hypothetical protein
LARGAASDAAKGWRAIPAKKLSETDLDRIVLARREHLSARSNSNAGENAARSALPPTDG